MTTEIDAATQAGMQARRQPRPSAMQDVIEQNLRMPASVTFERAKAMPYALADTPDRDYSAEIDEIVKTVKGQQWAINAVDAAWRDDHDILAGRINELAARMDAPSPTPSPSIDGKAYNFKVAPELLWAIGTAAGTVLLQAAADVENVTDYRTWIVGVGAGLIRAVIGVLLSQSKPCAQSRIGAQAADRSDTSSLQLP